MRARYNFSVYVPFIFSIHLFVFLPRNERYIGYEQHSDAKSQKFHCVTPAKDFLSQPPTSTTNLRLYVAHAMVAGSVMHIRKASLGRDSNKSDTDFVVLKLFLLF